MKLKDWARGGTKCTECQATNRAARSRNPAIGESDPKIQERFEKEFDEEANKRKKLMTGQASRLTTGSFKLVAWRCPIHNQAYEMVVSAWVRGGTKCTKCQAASRAAKCRNPAICKSNPKIQHRFEKEFDEEANKGKKLTKDQVSRLTTGSGKIVAWMCPIHGERYEMVLRKWTSGRTKCMGCRAAIKMLIV